MADGMLLLRVTPGQPVIGGSWLQVDPSLAPPEASAFRLLEMDAPEGRSSLELAQGHWTAMRFDDAGRVIDRRNVSGGSATALEVDATVNVGGAGFLVVSGGELDGWAIRDDARHALHLIEDAADSAD